MAVIMPDVLMGEVVSKVQDLFSGVVADSRVSVAVAPFFDAISAPYIQVIPGPGETVNPMSWDGQIVEDIQIVIFDQLRLDRSQESTVRLTDEALGMVRHRTRLWGDGINADPSGFIGTTLDDALIAPALLTRWSKPSQNPSDPAWLMLSSTFRISYAIE